jgi:hypothetical protein
MTLRRATAICIALLCLPIGALRAQDATDAERMTFERIILDQMAAFQSDDGELAFSFAAPRIRQMFESSERFMSMVKNGYQPVYRPQAVTFGDITDELGHPTQRVHVIGPQGFSWVALYAMQQQDDGNWRIAACVLVRGPDVGA